MEGEEDKIRVLMIVEGLETAQDSSRGLSEWGGMIMMMMRCCVGCREFFRRRRSSNASNNARRGANKALVSFSREDGRRERFGRGA